MVKQKNKLLFVVLLLNCYTTLTAATRTGSCGKSATYSYDDVSCALTISGSGAMSDFSLSEIPWYSWRESIKSIVIEPGITRVGMQAFFFCTKAESISLPYTLESIGSYAFNDCRALTEIVIPERVTMIEYDAFIHCCNLQSIKIPASVTQIQGNIFSMCDALTNIEVSQNNVYYDSRNNCNAVIDTRTNKLLSGCQTTIIPNTVTSIGQMAFYCITTLKKINIPSSITSIGSIAFTNCSNLKDIYISHETPPTFTLDGISNFGTLHVPTGCKNLYDSSSYWSKFTISEGNRFPILNGTCGSTLTYDIYDDYSMEIHGTGSMNTYTSSSVPWYSQRYNITSIEVDEGATSLSPYAFYYCSNAKTIKLPNTLKTLGTYCMAYSGVESMTLPGSITSFGTYALAYCSKMKELTLEEGITNIGNSGVRSCTSLATVNLPSTLTSINKNSFRGCTSLKTIVYPTNSVPTMGEDILRDDFTSIGTGTLYVRKAGLAKFKSTYPWSFFGNIVALYCTNLKDGEAYNEGEDKEQEEITYTRTFNNTNWQALYVPFAMSYDDWKYDFEVASINTVKKDNDQTIIEVVKLKEGQSIEPNTPYFIKAKTTGEKIITLENAMLYKTEETTYNVTTMYNSFNFIGTYHTISDMATKGYYAMAGGALKTATSDAATLQPFRWYLSVTDRYGHPVTLNSKSMNIVFDDGETTGIENVNNEAKESSSIHSLTGISKGNDAKTLAPGIYIKNGKKFIVK